MSDGTAAKGQRPSVGAQEVIEISDTDVPRCTADAERLAEEIVERDAEVTVRNGDV